MIKKLEPTILRYSKDDIRSEYPKPAEIMSKINEIIDELNSILPEED